MIRHFFGAHPAAFAILIIATLMVRALVPSGWMPSAVPGEAITLCSGNGMVKGWVDATGKLHTENQPGDQSVDQPCAYAGLNMAANVPADSSASTINFFPAELAQSLSGDVAIGRGLAAPPPPATGPPPLI